MMCRTRWLRSFSLAASLAILFGVGGAARADQLGSTAIKLDAIPLGPESDLPAMWHTRHDGVVDAWHLTGTNRNVVASDGGRRIVLLAGKGSRQFVYIDGQKGAEYQEILQQVDTTTHGDFQPALLISADKERVAYVARKAGNQLVVVVDHVESPAYDKLWFIRFAPTGHRLIYVAQRGPKQFLVDDGKEGPPCDDVDLNQILFSPDGRRLAYVCGIRVTGELASHTTNGDFWRTVVDGRPSPVCLGIGLMTFSADSRHLAFVPATGANRINPSQQIVLDGVAGRKYWLIRGDLERETVDGHIQDRYRLAISGDGAHVAFISAKNPPNLLDVHEGDLPHFVVTDGKAGPAFEHVRNIVISPDGRRIVYVAENHENGRLKAHLIENGQPGPGYSEIGTVLFSPDSKKLIYFASNKDKGVVVIDGQESDCSRDFYDSISPVIFSNNGQHMAYLDRDEQSSSKVVVVLDGKRFALSGNAAVRDCRLEFLPDDQHAACYAYDSGSRRVSWSVVGGSDDAAQPTQMVFSPDGKHVAEVFSGKSEQMQQKDARGRVNKFNWQHPPQLSIDGKSQEIDCTAIGKVCLSDDGKHYACVIYGGGISRRGRRSSSRPDAGFQINYDGRNGPACKKIVDLALSPDGRHVAYVSEEGRTATQAGVQHVVVDSEPGLEWQGMLPVHAPTFEFENCKLPEFLAFYPDGSLRFLAVRDGTLYRCRYKVATLDQMPSFELTSTLTRPPAAATAPETFSMDATNAANRRASEAYMAKDRVKTQAMVQKLRDDVDKRVRQQHAMFENPLGAQELLAFNPNNTDRQGSDLTGLVAAGDSLYGVNRAGGRNGDGVLFKLSLVGDFSAVHYFDHQADGSGPTSLLAAADGTLYGTFSKAAAAGAASQQSRFLGPRFAASSEVGLFHYDPKTDSFSVFDKTVPVASANSAASYPSVAFDAGASQSGATLCLVSQDRSVLGICGPKPTQIFRLNSDGKDLSMLKNSKDWQPFVDGGDGYFYGSNWDGLAKIKYDGSETTMLHKFAGGDKDGDAAIGAPVLLNNVMFGYASASPLRNSADASDSARPGSMRHSTSAMPRQGILYRMNRDGSDYSIIDDTVGDPRHDGPLLAADDGSAAYGICPKGVFKISASSRQTTMLVQPRIIFATPTGLGATLRAIRGTSLFLSAAQSMYSSPKILRLDSNSAPAPAVAEQKPTPPQAAAIEPARPVAAATRVQPQTAQNPWEAAAGRIPAVSMNVLKPLPLAIDPMQWSPAP